MDNEDVNECLEWCKYKRFQAWYLNPLNDMICKTDMRVRTRYNQPWCWMIIKDWFETWNRSHLRIKVATSLSNLACKPLTVNVLTIHVYYIMFKLYPPPLILNTFNAQRSKVCVWLSKYWFIADYVHKYKYIYIEDACFQALYAVKWVILSKIWMIWNVEGR